VSRWPVAGRHVFFYIKQQGKEENLHKHADRTVHTNGQKLLARELTIENKIDNVHIT